MKATLEGKKAVIEKYLVWISGNTSRNNNNSKQSDSFWDRESGQRMDGTVDEDGSVWLWGNGENGS